MLHKKKNIPVPAKPPLLKAPLDITRTQQTFGYQAFIESMCCQEGRKTAIIPQLQHITQTKEHSSPCQDPFLKAPLGSTGTQ